MDHGRFGPQGALGGADGAPNRVTVWQNGEPYIPEHLSKEQDIPMGPGDRVHVCTPGGGGYGDPLSRDPEAVLEDVRLERYTVAEADEMFGVVISGDPIAVDKDKTMRRRTDCD